MCNARSSGDAKEFDAREFDAKDFDASDSSDFEADWVT